MEGIMKLIAQRARDVEEQRLKVLTGGKVSTRRLEGSTMYRRCLEQVGDEELCREIVARQIEFALVVDELMKRVMLAALTALSRH